MADFFFFTEPSKLNNQTSGQAFGAIDENEFRIGNLFTASADAKAFAITDGLILVQQIGTSDRYNIILKPSEQPDLNLPKINYLIYKGIKKSSIVDGTKVAAGTNNDLTRVIHDNAVQWYAAEGIPIPSTEPSANTSLGLEYTSTNTDSDFAIQDSDFLDKIFYSSDALTLPFVFGGNYIGDFDSSADIGLTIIFEKIGFNPTFELARSLSDMLTFSPLGGNPTNAEIFRRKHEKENVHNFIDSSAFFGAFVDLGIKVFDGSAFVLKKSNDLYNDVVEKHFNKNKIYLDIRNESEDSFNYYENYSNTIEWSLDGTTTLTNVDYYRNNGWPLLIIDDSTGNSEFDPGNTDKTIKLTFPRGDNESPLVYYRRVYKEELGFNLPTGLEQFQSPSILNDKFSIEDLIPYLINDRASSNYYQIKIIKRVILENDENNDFPRQGYSMFKRSYLDNLFPIFDMKIPFTNANYTNLKLYYDSSYIDKVLLDSGTLNNGVSEYALRDYISSTGIASDANNITFMAFPFKYHINQDNNDDFIPLSGFETTGANPFLIELDNLVSQINLVRSNFLIGGSTQEYLNFVNNDIVNRVQSTNQYSFDDVIILSITRTEYQTLEQLKQQNFVGPYKVYLGIKNISVLTDDNGNKYSSFTYVLRGLTENNGEIETHEELSSITSITSDSVLGINSGHIFPIDKPFIEEDYGERNGGHGGIDIESTSDSATPGLPIYAVRSGTVTWIKKQEHLVENGGDDDDPAGVRIRIKGADNNIRYNYYHMEPGSNDNFNIGDFIQQGTQIGKIGLSGQGFNINPAWEQYHLHLELWSTDSRSSRINPYSIFPELALLPYERHRD